MGVIPELSSVEQATREFASKPESRRASTGNVIEERDAEGGDIVSDLMPISRRNSKNDMTGASDIFQQLAPKRKSFAAGSVSSSISTTEKERRKKMKEKLLAASMLSQKYVNDMHISFYI